MHEEIIQHSENLAAPLKILDTNLSQLNSWSCLSNSWSDKFFFHPHLIHGFLVPAAIVIGYSVAHVSTSFYTHENEVTTNCQKTPFSINKHPMTRLTSDRISNWTHDMNTIFRHLWHIIYVIIDTVRYRWSIHFNFIYYLSTLTHILSNFDWWLWCRKDRFARNHTVNSLVSHLIALYEVLFLFPAGCAGRMLFLLWWRHMRVEHVTE